MVLIFLSVRHLSKKCSLKTRFMHSTIQYCPVQSKAWLGIVKTCIGCSPFNHLFIVWQVGVPYSSK